MGVNAMTFKRATYDDLRFVLSWNAIREHIDEAYAEIDRLTQESATHLKNGMMWHCEYVKQAKEIDRLNQLVAKPIVPVFEVGKLYRNGHGDLCRFDRRTDPVGEYVYQSTFIEKPGIGSWHKQDGRGQFDGKYDLILPAVDPPPTWVPWPWLPDGKYVAEGNFVSIPGTNECHTISLSRKLRGYTSDPPEGIWEVTAPGVAVYRGSLK
jgi:hypothetical protein